MRLENGWDRRRRFPHGETNDRRSSNTPLSKGIAVPSALDVDTSCRSARQFKERDGLGATAHRRLSITGLEQPSLESGLALQRVARVAGGTAFKLLEPNRWKAASSFEILSRPPQRA